MVARLRVPGRFPAGLPDWPLRNGLPGPFFAAFAAYLQPSLLLVVGSTLNPDFRKISITYICLFVKNKKGTHFGGTVV
jgi:hypothetical protein